MFETALIKPLRLIETALFITDFIVFKIPSDVVCPSFDGARETRLSTETPARSCEAPGPKGASQLDLPM